MDVTPIYDPISKTYKILETSQENPTILSNFIKTKPGDCIILDNVYNPLLLTVNHYNTREEVSTIKNRLDNQLRGLIGESFEGSKIIYDTNKLKVKISTSFTTEEVTI